MINSFKDFLSGKITVDRLKMVEGVYANSIYEKDNSYIFLVDFNNVKSLIILGKGKIFDKFKGELFLEGKGKICPLNHNNAKVMRGTFSFTSPKSYNNYPISVGLGDRLGIASPGHLRLTEKYDFFPVIAQQSIRELELTGRTYSDVLDSSTWAVFQEGYEDGYGFDGDHLKKDKEIQMALENGATMITLDLSDYIQNEVYDMKEDEIDKKYKEIPKDIRDNLENKYLNKEHVIDGELSIQFTERDLKKNVLIYLDGINYGIHVYNKFIVNSKDKIDYEISIDETLHTTTIQAHYFVATELVDNGVKIRSLAPRFCGEFQKGIDYIGNIEEFKKEFHMHFKISKYFRYKLSIHSGSDKFSIFPTIGEYTKGLYHLKTAGTNWLVAIEIIADKDPDLFRKIYNFAFENLDEAKRYYHVNVSKNDRISIDDMDRKDLINILEDDDIRQVLHITYGLILQNKDGEGRLIFGDKIYKCLNKYEDEYYKALYAHIGKHLELLGVENKDN